MPSKKSLASRAGYTQLLVLALLVLGLAVGLGLVQKRTNLLPFARDLTIGPICNTGLKSLNTGTFCGKRTYRVANYICWDGTSGQLGSPKGVCKTSSQWREEADKTCSGKTYCQPTTGPIFVVPTPPPVSPTNPPIIFPQPIPKPPPAPTVTPSPTPSPKPAAPYLSRIGPDDIPWSSSTTIQLYGYFGEVSDRKVFIKEGAYGIPIDVTSKATLWSNGGTIYNLKPSFDLQAMYHPKGTTIFARLYVEVAGQKSEEVILKIGPI